MYSEVRIRSCCLLHAGIMADVVVTDVGPAYMWITNMNSRAHGP